VENGSQGDEVQHSSLDTHRMFGAAAAAAVDHPAVTIQP